MKLVQLDIQTKPSSTCCAFCGAKEGEAHHFRGFKVKHHAVLGFEGEENTCQSYRIIYRNTERPKAPKVASEKFFGSIVMFLFIIVLGLIFSDIASAQPGLPGAPDQAPIDGGLGLLAAVGGIYAYKKLKTTNQDVEI